jgi:putative transposase
LICSFIDQMRARNYRVESICRVLTEQGVAVAGRTYRNWKKAAPSARTITDAGLTDALRATVGTPEGMYGRRKMTAYLRRQGHQVAACTVDRLMGDEGLSGVVRGRKHRTTVAGGKDSRRAPDLLDRDFTAVMPNRKWVTDFTYCRTWSGFVYVAFVIDCFSRAIVGWHAATVKDTVMVTTALKMALWRRDHAERRVAEGLIHHSDAGSQYTSIAFAETLVLEGIAASIGSIGDAYDNALAETTIGLFKTEAVGRGSPFLAGPLRVIDDVEYATMEWVDWFNNRRLHSVLDYVPPEEYESAYYAQTQGSQPAIPQPSSRHQTRNGSYFPTPATPYSRNMQRSSSPLRDCSSTAERAVKNELPAANLEPHYRPKVNAVKDFRWDDWRRGTKLRMRSCFSPPT